MIRICPERDAQCPNGMDCPKSCGSPHPLTPREKAADRLCDKVQAEYSHILNALASGSGDHAELARLAEAATPGPWVSQGRYIGTPKHMSYVGEVRDQNGNWSDTTKSRSDAAFIAAFIAATVLALLAENAALRSEIETMTTAGIVEVAVRNPSVADYVQHWEGRATEAERKLAEAVGLFKQIEEHHGIECIPDNEIQAAIRTLISKEAERG